MIPIKGMKVEPLGLPLMGDAWLSFVFWFAGIDTYRAWFKKETNIDLSKLLHRSPLEMMIDESTGFERDAICQWCDWVTINFWGINK